MVIKEWTILASGSNGSDVAERAIEATEKLRAATGIDLGAVARRFSRSD
jgi:hypothetical protein